MNRTRDKYYVGQKVKVKNLYLLSKERSTYISKGFMYYWSCGNSEDSLFPLGGTSRKQMRMHNYIGKTITISKLMHGSGFYIKEDGGLNRWNYWMLDTEGMRKEKILGVLNAV